METNHPHLEDIPIDLAKMCFAIGGGAATAVIYGASAAALTGSTTITSVANIVLLGAVAACVMLVTNRVEVRYLRRRYRQMKQPLH